MFKRILHALDKEKISPERAIQLRDENVALSNRLIAVRRECSELRRTLELRDSTIAYQARALSSFLLTVAQNQDSYQMQLI
jgi:hypothetical protein